MEAKMMLWVVVATSFWWNSMSWPSPRNFPSFLRNVVSEKTGNSHEVSSAIRISGPNGYCVDVKHGNYRDGNHIILWPCKSGPDVNQLWTFESDGTVKSNGKCLATNGYSQASNIMIYNCYTAAKNSTIWQLKDNGEIVNLVSGLVLTAVTGKVQTELTLETNIYSSFQTWRVGNDTTPSLACITGLNGLCLQESDDAVWLAECETSNVGQRWLLYPDGTIRPKLNRNGCLSYHDLINKRVLVLSCGLGASSQRWLFTDSGTILNERANLVMDVKHANPDLKEIIVYHVTGNPNQKWEILPLSV